MDTRKYTNFENGDANTTACEPLPAYNAANIAVDEIGEMPFLPDDILEKAIKVALTEKSEGKLVSCDKAMDLVYEELGWK